MSNKRIGIVGYGRFGRLWAELLAPYHSVLVTDKVPLQTERFRPLSELCEFSDALFLCVPINQFEPVVHEIKTHLRPGTAIFDVCSVKAHPAAVLLSQLGGIDGLTLIASHPMFGPDSAAQGVQGLPLVLWRLAGDEGVYREWLGLFEQLGVRIVEMSPNEHDRLAAYSQGVTHYVGRVLREMDLQPTAIDTQGFKILRSLIDQTCNDSWELFRDLQLFNPHTREMRERLEVAMATVSRALERSNDSEV